LDQAALVEKWKTILHEESLDLIRHTNAEISPVYAKDKPYIPVDLDVSPFDNSKTKKEGIWKMENKGQDIIVCKKCGSNKVNKVPLGLTAICYGWLPLVGSDHRVDFGANYISYLLADAVW
jgi:hypothetical protein